jgi:hypothetical protein
MRQKTLKLLLKSAGIPLKTQIIPQPRCARSQSCVPSRSTDTRFDNLSEPLAVFSKGMTKCTSATPAKVDCFIKIIDSLYWNSRLVDVVFSNILKGSMASLFAEIFEPETLFNSFLFLNSGFCLCNF